MRTTILLLSSIFLPIITFGQVGIETTDPIATLDVNGDVRIATTVDGLMPLLKILF